MRVIKERLKQLSPGVAIFLDVDDLDDIGALEDYVRASGLVLVFLSAGYLESKNCLRELRAAVAAGKPLLVVAETERERGAITEEEARDACDDEALLSALYASDPVDWYRISEFQTVRARAKLMPSAYQ